MAIVKCQTEMFGDPVRGFASTQLVGANSTIYVPDRGPPDNLKVLLQLAQPDCVCRRIPAYLAYQPTLLPRSVLCGVCVQIVSWPMTLPGAPMIVRKPPSASPIHEPPNLIYQPSLPNTLQGGAKPS